MPTLARPRSRWRQANWLLLVAALGLWAIALAWSLSRTPPYPGWAAAAVCGVVLTAIAWRFDRHSARGALLLAIGIGFAFAGTWSVPSLLAAEIALTVVASELTERRSLQVLAGVVLMHLGRSAYMAVVEPVPWTGPLMDTVLMVLLLSIGWYVGRLVGRLETTADELWLAHRELQAHAALQGELLLAEERTRAAQELHDGLGHQLTLIRMSLDFAERMRERDPERAWNEVREASRLAATALQDMRAWVRAMAPPDIDGGIGAMLTSVAASFTSTGLDVSVSCTGDERELGEGEKLFVRRVVQESLTNVIKHSDATHVRIDAAFVADELRLAVVDDGRAVDDETVVEGFGLRSLRERAEALGGRCSHSRTPSGAFRVLAAIPLTRERMGA